MFRPLKKPLSASAIEALPAGVHKIAPRLYLKRIDGRNGPRRYLLFRWQQDGKPQSKSLGPWSVDRYAQLLSEGNRANEALAEDRDPRIAIDDASDAGTFKEVAENFLADNLAAFTNETHKHQWRRSIRDTYPVLGHLRIEQIEVGHIAKALAADWLRVPVYAQRTRRRIEQVLSYAIARGDLKQANPAAFDLVRHRLPKQGRRQVQHMRALPYAKVPALFAALAGERLVSSEALRFAILTSARTSEVRHMTWADVDLDEGIWSVPGERMKTGRPHRVALSKAALGILADMKALSRSKYVFPGSRAPDTPISKNTLALPMKRLGFTDGVVHGLRSSYKDWAREQTKFSWELVELSLSHEIGNAVERAYGRSDLLHLRRPLAEAWAAFVVGKTAKPRKQSTAIGKPGKAAEGPVLRVVAGGRR